MRHEPCGSDEVFLGNTHTPTVKVEWFAAHGLNTVRLGRIAYCIAGKPLSESYRPIFIARSEERKYDSIMMRETFGENWSR